MTKFAEVREKKDADGVLEGYTVVAADGSSIQIPVGPPGSNSQYDVLKAQIDAGDPDLTILPWAPPSVGWKGNRTSNVAGGGYGSFSEQLEILGEQGISAYQQHIAAVKAAHPKE